MIPKRFYTSSGFLLLAILFIVFNSANNWLFSGVRLDLTEQGLYSLSNGTKEIIDSIEEPVQMYFFFSDKATTDQPSIRNYARRVRELLEEYESRSSGKLVLQVVDPEPFSAAEEQAAQLGVQPAQPRAGREAIYFGLVVIDALDRHQTIPLFNVNRETSLEYEVSELIYNVLHPEKPQVGILSTVDMTTGAAPGQPNASQSWAILDHVKNSFDVRTLDKDLVKVPLGIDVLMLVRPSALSDNTLYAIEQFLAHGGNALVFVDPIVDSVRDENNAYVDNTQLSNIFKSWGIAFDAATIVGDPSLSISVNAGGVAQRHPAYMNITEPSISSLDIVTSQLDSIILGSVGSISILENNATNTA